MAKKWLIKNRISDEYFIQVCKKAKSMASAAQELNLHFNSFKKRAIELDCYSPNQPGKGLNKNMPQISLDEIIKEGKHPSYQTYKLKQRLLQENIKQNICEICGITEWNSKSIQMELHHKDGNRSNHLLKNLVMICPNCHSQTSNFRARNKKSI